jgi:hypothetical protein
VSDVVVVSEPYRQLQREACRNSDRQKKNRCVENVDELSHLPAPVWLTTV